jgi:putative transposase
MRTGVAPVGKGTKAALDEQLGRDLSERDVAMLMIDGVHFAEVCCLVCTVILADGTEIPVGDAKGDTENATLVPDLLADLVARGLFAEGGPAVVIDDAKALAAAVKSVFGKLAPIQRCQLHKRRNVLDYLAKKDRGWVETGWSERSSTPTWTKPLPTRVALRRARSTLARRGRVVPCAASGGRRTRRRSHLQANSLTAARWKTPRCQWS